MLSHYEQRVLAEIERELGETDPRLARRLAHARERHSSRRARLARAAGLTVGLLLLAVAVAVHSAAVGIAGGTVLLADAAWVFASMLARGQSGHARVP